MPKRRLFFTLIVLAGGFDIGAKGASAANFPTLEDQAVSAALPSGLSVTTRILNQKFIVRRIDKGDRVNLRLHLAFSFQNTGDRAIIIYRSGGDVFHYTIRSKSDTGPKTLVFRDEYLDRFVGPKIRRRTFPPSKPTHEFVVLSPNRTWNKTVYVEIPRSGADRKFRSGDYILELQLQTWVWGGDEGRMLRERWAKYGSFWYEAITSEPVRLYLGPEFFAPGSSRHLIK